MNQPINADPAPIARAFDALAHPSRVTVLLKLMPYALKGMTAGEIAQRTGLPPSTLSHHLKEMENGGVITRTALGRKTIVRPSLDTLTSIASLLTQLCCQDDGQLSPQNAALENATPETRQPESPTS